MDVDVDRRQLFNLGLATAAVATGPALLVPGIAAAQPIMRAAKKLRLLVLGGTKFLGPAVVRAALARGHEVTLFNRQRTQPWLFHGLERLKGNRFPEIDEGLKPLAGKSWDAVLDLNAYYPRLVEASCQALRGSVGQYVVMSSISVYADYKVVGLDETAATRTLRASFQELPDLEENGWDTYGARKVLCEQVAARHFPDRWASVRATNIHGEGSDGSGAYWPLRIQRGDRILGPGDGSDPVQLVDVKDVADLLLTIVERRLTGLYNAVGPARPITLNDYVASARAAVGGSGTVIWHPAHRAEFRSIPLYAPRSIVPGFQRITDARSRAVGFTNRPLQQTIVEDMVSFVERKGAGVDLGALGIGLAAAQESVLLAT